MSRRSDANGRQTPWPASAHIEPEDARESMRQVVDRLYTIQTKGGNLTLVAMMDRARAEAREWDEP